MIRRDGLLDQGLLREHAVGWEELEPLLERCTPGWGERVTGVPADAIEQAARWYGTGPSLLWIGQGFQRQPRGGNAVRAYADTLVDGGTPPAGIQLVTRSAFVDKESVSEVLQILAEVGASQLLIAGEPIWALVR